MISFIKALRLKLACLLDPKVLRDKLSGFLDVRPRDPEDYYTLFSWMISKKLAAFLMLFLGAAGLTLILVLRPAPSGEGRPEMRTYSWRSLPLRFYKGEVEILGRGGYTAYQGFVEKGAAKGSGRLFNRESGLVYEGEFENSRYNGHGRLYHKNGALSFEGEFVDNVPQGAGVSYRTDGSKEYEGSFAGGEKSGEGILFDGSSNAVYQGTFQNGRPWLEGFLGKTTKEAGERYVGNSRTYLAKKELCVAMTQLGAVYRAASGEDSLEGDWVIDKILILGSAFPDGTKTLTTKEELFSCFGKPAYEGAANLDLSELAAEELLYGKKGKIEGKETFDNVLTVSGFWRVEGRIAVFTREALVYTFYFEEDTERFSWYAVEPVR